MTSSPIIHYIDKNLAAMTITNSLLHLALMHAGDVLNTQDQIVLAALKLSDPIFENQSLDFIQDFIKGFSEKQIVALVKKIKNTIHDMSFIRLENSYGDALYAYYMKAQNQQSFDVWINEIGDLDSWKIQFQNYNNPQQKHHFSKRNAEDVLLPSYDLSQKIIAEQPNLKHKELAQSIQDAMDLWITAKDPNDQHFWDYFPAISIASVSLAIFDLFRRYQKNQITWSEFKWMSAKVSGLKVSKIAFIGLLLSLPIVGQLTGAFLVANLLLNAKSTWFDKDSPMYKKLIQLISKTEENKQ